MVTAVGTEEAVDSEVVDRSDVVRTAAVERAVTVAAMEEVTRLVGGGDGVTTDNVGSLVGVVIIGLPTVGTGVTVEATVGVIAAAEVGILDAGAATVVDAALEGLVPVPVLMKSVVDIAMVWVRPAEEDSAPLVVTAGGA